MKLIRHHPLACLILLVLLGVFSGYFGGMYLLEREVKKVEEFYKDKEYDGSPPEVRGGGLWYAMLGTSAGAAAGLVVGLTEFVTVKAGPSESLATLGLSSDGERKT